MDIYKKNNIMNKFNRLNLKGNPFRITPSTNVNEIIWAGFPEVKNRIKMRIKQAIDIPNSSLILNWGEYGSGKTHALRYFSSQNVLKDIAEKYLKNGDMDRYWLFIYEVLPQSSLQGEYKVLKKQNITFLKAEYQKKIK